MGKKLATLFAILIAALVVGYWDDIQNHVDKWTRPAVAPSAMGHTPASDIEFYCPMHPDVIREQQGQCPKCGMPLVERKKGVAEQLPAASSDARIARSLLTLVQGIATQAVFDPDDWTPRRQSEQLRTGVSALLPAYADSVAS